MNGRVIRKTRPRTSRRRSTPRSRRRSASCALARRRRMRGRPSKSKTMPPMRLRRARLRRVRKRRLTRAASAADGRRYPLRKAHRRKRRPQRRHRMPRVLKQQEHRMRALKRFPRHRALPSEGALPERPKPTLAAHRTRTHKPVHEADRERALRAEALAQVAGAITRGATVSRANSRRRHVERIDAAMQAGWIVAPVPGKAVRGEFAPPTMQLRPQEVARGSPARVRLLAIASASPTRFRPCRVPGMRGARILSRRSTAPRSRIAQVLTRAAIRASSSSDGAPSSRSSSYCC